VKVNGFGNKSNFKPSKVRDVPDRESWVPIRSKLMRFLIERPLSKNAWRVLLRLMEEHCNHAGKENGFLVVTHDQFRRQCGLRGHAIKPAIDELVRAGLLRVERQGIARGHDGIPSLYRLTFLKSKFVPIAGSPYFIEPSWDGKGAPQPTLRPPVSQCRKPSPRKTGFSVSETDTQPVSETDTQKRPLQPGFSVSETDTTIYITGYQKGRRL
jgi:hypothetical protein